MTLKLNPPEAVPVVEKEEAITLVKDELPISNEKLAVIESKAVNFVNDLTALTPSSPEFTKRLDNIFAVGDKEIRLTASISSRMLERPMQEGSKNSPQMKVASTLQELRQQITELDPSRADLKGVKRLIKWMPGGNKVDAYFNRYATAESHLKAITRALAEGQDELRRDNAYIEVYHGEMWKNMGKLKEWNELLEQMDEAISDKLEAANIAGNTELAKVLENDALFAVRQRRMDIQTQIAVALQGYLALELVQKNNKELIRGIDRAQTTTMAAMQTAVVVATALNVQERVLTQLTALNSTTSNFIEGTSERLKNQGAQIQQQASTSMLEVDKLENAFKNVIEAMDAIDGFKAQANQNFSQTIIALETQVKGAQQYLERSHRE